MEYVRQTITEHGLALGIPVVIDGSKIFEVDYTTANVRTNSNGYVNVILLIVSKSFLEIRSLLVKQKTKTDTLYYKMYLFK